MSLCDWSSDVCSSDLTIRTTAAIDTDSNKVGDYFTATLEEPFMMGNQVLIPRGAEIKGRITESKESDRKSTRLNSSHTVISYAVFCLKKKITIQASMD